MFSVSANEPSAAGFEYAHRYRSTITAKREYVVIYDLGGGTFDASLLKMTGRWNAATHQRRDPTPPAVMKTSDEASSCASSSTSRSCARGAHHPRA